MAKSNPRKSQPRKPTPSARKARPIAAVNLPAKAPAPEANQRLVYILSDSTGNLARHMLIAFLTQFPPDAFKVDPRTFLQDELRLGQALDVVAAAPGIVFHAVVSREFKRIIEERCARIGAPAMDLTGNFVEFLSRQSGLQPSADHRRLHHTGKVYHQRIKAIEFALHHDDGLGLDTLHQADLVLAGISRTSKSPTSIYLAQQGLNVGNVSLAHGVDPPRELLAMPSGKVVGLVIDAAQLVEIRARRQKEWMMSGTRYADPESVEAEIEWSRRLFRGQGWPILNVTDQAVEETAAKILNLLRITTS